MKYSYTIHFRCLSGKDYFYPIDSEKHTPVYEGIPMARREIATKHLIGEHRLKLVKVEPKKLI